MSELRTDSGYTAVGATSRRPAYVLGAVVLLGMVGGLAGLFLLPASTTESWVAPAPAIGGGPPAEAPDESTGAVCHTDDGAPYEADRCPSE